jgi:hypothetical protein
MLLADVAFLPFPTQLLAQALRLRAGLPAAERYLHQVKRRFLIGLACYGLATVLALIAPAVSLVCYTILIMYFWLPPQGETSATSVLNPIARRHAATPSNL